MILQGDCREVMRTLEANSVDAIVTDPPYGLGFMGKNWDHAVPGVAFWIEALRVAKPGAYLLAFGGTRKFHRLACAIEDAGWEIRDSILRGHTPEDCPWLLAWAYGSGFPKSHNGEWGGTALKPAWEPIIMARKPLEGTVEANWRKHGTGALNIDGCRVGTEGARNNGRQAGTNGIYGHIGSTVPVDYGKGRWPANVIHDGSEEVLAAFPDAPGQLADASSSSSSRKTNNVYGAMRRGRGDEPSADSDNEGAVGFKMKPGARRLDTSSAARFFYCAKASRADRNAGCEGMEQKMPLAPNGAENAVGSKRGSNSKPRENFHPTVKPTDLMRWLCRLVTPPGGLVLDPFTGSGSTGRGAILEGFRFTGIELDPEYARIAQARIAAAVEQRAEEMEEHHLATAQTDLFAASA